MRSLYAHAEDSIATRGRLCRRQVRSVFDNIVFYLQLSKTQKNTVLAMVNATRGSLGWKEKLAP